MSRGRLRQAANAQFFITLRHDEYTQVGDQFTCDGFPGWLPLPEEDAGKTPGKLFAKYSEDGFRGLRVQRPVRNYAEAYDVSRNA